MIISAVFEPRRCSVGIHSARYSDTMCYPQLQCERDTLTPRTSHAVQLTNREQCVQGVYRGVIAQTLPCTLRTSRNRDMSTQEQVKTVQIDISMSESHSMSNLSMSVHIHGRASRCSNSRC